MSKGIDAFRRNFYETPDRAKFNENLEIIENELLRLEQIDNVKPIEALESMKDCLTPNGEIFEHTKEYKAICKAISKSSTKRTVIKAGKGLYLNTSLISSIQIPYEGAKGYYYDIRMSDGYTHRIWFDTVKDRDDSLNKITKEWSECQ